ncbi:ABC transporter permease [Flavitalea sp. BT771]|uniref:ABC transporter permease n=1 Tax=Flavitalea sp. BT771 TaxID=3063329 RepID=UPI0026E3F165|nr:ABC transporter permease [Flavitalea sp. BT771]MDO6429288.1 ABC transporter permease [Flavitalea sp. BT771]MDV6218584.1 ABC transporter permease [Flavitalea sp. BT771]
MFRNYLKTAFRNLLRNRTSTTINILGLALGLAAFICINAYVRREKSFDRMLVPAGASVYRVESRFYRGSQLTDDWPTSTNGYALALKEHFPEVADFTRINWNNSERVVRNGTIRFREAQVCFADSNFFSFFQYGWLKGDKATALKDVNSVVISASAARKYFGNSDPLGKMLEISTISTVLPCRVTGVFQDAPPNSTMQFAMLISWASSPEWQKKTWYQHESYTFLRLVPGARAASLEAQFPAMAEGYKNGPALKDLRWAIHLVPMEDIHLNAAKQYEVEPKGNRRAVQFLDILSLVILLIACVNYINLSTAKALERAKEVGIRKVSGARPGQLMFQFILESLLLGSIAFVLGIALSGLAGALLPAWLGIDHGFGMVVDGSFWKITGLVFLAAVVVSSIYPSFVLTRFQPVTVLKGRFAFSKSGAYIRKGLVTFQFAVALALIAGTLAVQRQIMYMSGQDTGVEIQQTLVLKAPVRTTGYDEKAAALKHTLLALPGIAGVTASGAVPGREVGMFLANRRFGADKSEERTYEMLKVDHDFIPQYHLEMLAGRPFDRSRPADSLGLVLNESAVRQLGFASPEDAVGKQVWLEVNPGRTDKVIGVVRDYHQRSLQMAYTPLILFMDPAYRWIPTQYFSVKVATKDMTGTVDEIRKAWDKLFPESSFDSFFLDEFYGRQYRDDRNFARISGLFSGLSIFIGVIGLLGLTAFAAARRNREIGVRKVLGASVGQIMSLLTWDFVRLILLASLFALPLSLIAIRQWMQGFAFRASLNWSLLLAPVPVLIIITLATTGWLTLRAARVNPVRSLKEE